MSTPGGLNNLLLASAAEAAAGGDRSLRFNSSDSAYLSRTPSVAGNRKTWTWAGWVKRSGLDSFNRFFTAGNGTTDSTFLGFLIRDNNVFTLEGGSTIYRRTSSVFRDASAWYHLVVAFDTTQATGDDRIKIYINGIQLTVFATSNDPSLNSDHPINNNVVHDIGANHYGGGLNFNSDFYLADIHFIDGQALDPSSFGEFDDNGIWQPITYTGSYGTNGFHLPFSDNSTAAALGTDTSGNSNTWTVNNISVAAGAGNDSLVDVPTNGTETDTGVGGEVRGNYCTLNPLNSTGTLSNGNLDVDTSAATFGYGLASGFGMVSGKWYFEATVNSSSGTNAPLIALVTAGFFGSTVHPGSTAFGWEYQGASGNKRHNSASSSYGSSFTTGDTVACAFDADTGSLTFYKNGVSQGVAYTGLTSGPYFFALGDHASSGSVTFSVNFGQRPFAYTAPSGFKALNTANLPAPVVTKPSEYMDVALYTGNGSTQTISGLEFSPDFVWTKARSFAENNNVFDTIRGTTKLLLPDSTNAEQTISGITAFNSDGYTVGSHVSCNSNGQTYVSWTWDAGSSTVSNTDGSITSQVRANPSAGFSIVTYTGNGTSGATIGHGLGVAPDLVIAKRRSSSNNWWVYHRSLGGTKYLVLDLTNAAGTANTIWNDTNPSSTVVTLGGGESNTNTETYVAYCFAPVDGYSSFGSYTGNGSTDGPFVYTGFRPKWILLKSASVAPTDWLLLDTKRDIFNVMDSYLQPNTANSEGTFTLLDTLSNGFKLRNTAANSSGETVVWAAFAESPFQYARAR